jgi:predicted RNase H-like nuclease (RuvC/YqgF family)
VDISQSPIPPDPPTPPTRTSEALRADLRSAISQLDHLKEKWKQQKQQLLGQNAALQDTAKKLDAEVRSARDEVKRAVERERTGLQKKAGIQGVSQDAITLWPRTDSEDRSSRARKTPL